jgi:hypothetical protein
LHCCAFECSDANARRQSAAAAEEAAAKLCARGIVTIFVVVAIVIVVVIVVPNFTVAINIFVIVVIIHFVTIGIISICLGCVSNPIRSITRLRCTIITTVFILVIFEICVCEITRQGSSSVVSRCGNVACVVFVICGHGIITESSSDCIIIIISSSSSIIIVLILIVIVVAVSAHSARASLAHRPRPTHHWNCQRRC